jgi:hypothetical protein
MPISSAHSLACSKAAEKFTIKVQSKPSEQDVGDALELIQEVFCDFPIIGESSLANHLATVLTPFAKILSTLRTGPEIILVDNLRGKLDKWGAGEDSDENQLFNQRVRAFPHYHSAQSRALDCHRQQY